jgi:HEAT repeat protein
MSTPDFPGKGFPFLRGPVETDWVPIDWDKLNALRLEALTTNDLIKELESKEESSGYDPRFQDPKKIRKLAVDALVKLGASAVDSLVNALGNPRIYKSDIIQALFRIGKPSVLPLCAALENGNSDVRRFAADSLGVLRDPRAIPVLSARVADSDKHVRAQVFVALATIGGPCVSDALSKGIVDPDEEVRVEVAVALGKISDPRAMDLLLDLLRDVSDRVRETAISAIGKQRDPRVVQALCDSLKNDTATTCEAAIKLLDDIGDVSAIGALCRALNYDGFVPWHAANALARIGDATAIEPLLRAHMKHASYGGGYFVCTAIDKALMAIAVALSRLGGERVIEPMLRIAVYKPHLDLSAIRVAREFVDSQKAQPLDVLCKVIAGVPTDRYVMRKIEEALENPAQGEVLKRLEEGVFDAEPKILKKIGAVGRLIKLAGDNWWEGYIGHEDLANLITLNPAVFDRCLRGPNEIGREALDYLIEIGSVAVDELVNALGNNPKDCARRCAAVALKMIGDKRAVDALCNALGDSVLDVRWFSAAALAEYNDVRAVPPLCKALGKDHRLLPAIDALGGIGDEGGIHTLEKILQTSTEIKSRRRAAEIMVQLGVRSAKKYLPAFILDWLEYAAPTRDLCYNTDDGLLYYAPRVRHGYETDHGLNLMATFVGLDAELLRLASEALGCAVNVYRDEYKEKLRSYYGGMNEIYALRQREEVWSSCILYRVGKRKDVCIALVDGGYMGEPTYGRQTLSFEGERQAAREDLLRRGFGDEDPITLLQASLSSG